MLDVGYWWWKKFYDLSFDTHGINNKYKHRSNLHFNWTFEKLIKIIERGTKQNEDLKILWETSSDVIKMKGSSYSLRVMKNARQYAAKNTLETPSKVRIFIYSETRL